MTRFINLISDNTQLKYTEKRTTLCQWNYVQHQSMYRFKKKKYPAHLGEWLWTTATWNTAQHTRWSNKIHSTINMTSAAKIQHDYKQSNTVSEWVEFHVSLDMSRVISKTNLCRQSTALVLTIKITTTKRKYMNKTRDRFLKKEKVGLQDKQMGGRVRHWVRAP